MNRGGNGNHLSPYGQAGRSKTGRDYTYRVHPATYVFRHIDLSKINCYGNRQIPFAGLERPWGEAEVARSIRMIKNQIGIHSFCHRRRPVAESRRHSQTGDCRAENVQRYVHESLRLAHCSENSSNHFPIGHPPYPQVGRIAIRRVWKRV